MNNAKNKNPERNSLKPYPPHKLQDIHQCPWKNTIRTRMNYMTIPERIPANAVSEMIVHAAVGTPSSMKPQRVDTRIMDEEPKPNHARNAGDRHGHHHHRRRRMSIMIMMST